MSIEELEQYFLDHYYSSYERNNYDEFLEYTNFSFTTKAIHISGTNGKGSTANYLYNIYLANGYKVGLYTSPYLTDVTEMIKINGQNIPFNEYERLFLKYKSDFEKFHLSSFEMQTFIAYQYFSEQKLDLVIIEVGMGGSIDATNVINPVLSIISNVSLEHTAYLGRSISEIAYNKAGIIKENVPVLVGKLEESAMYAIKEYAKTMNSKLYVVNDFYNEHLVDGKYHFDYLPIKDIQLNTNSFYELTNASLAIEATRILSNLLPVSEKKIKKGLKCNLLPCRFEYIGRNILLDGAHNPDGIHNLVISLEKNENRPIHVIFAAFKDKNIESMLIELGNISNDVTLTTFHHKRARTQDDYFLYLGDYKFNDNYMTLIKEKSLQFPDDLILVTGSLAFVGMVRKEMKL